MNGIEKAISRYGSAKRVAAALGVTQQAVSFWRNGKRVFPAELCIVLERESQGAISCEELRPDVDWAYLRGTASIVMAAASDIEPAAAGQGV